jgi:hypothetical protein
LQKDKISNISVPVRYELMPFEDDRFKRCKILVMHDGLNLNGSVFNMDAIESAKESLKNVPILGFVRQSDGTDEADFGGHESELILSNDGIKYRYLGRPIGVIPADANDYHYEIYDDKTFVAVTGYIWTDYANEALDILEASGEKGQSMEIRVDDGEWDINDNFVITKYRYTGVTILGDNVTPAMTGAKVQLFSADDNTYSEEYFAMVDELNVALKNYASQSQESEVSDMEDEKELQQETPIEGEETPIEGEETPIEGETHTEDNLETNSVEGETETPEPENTPEKYTVMFELSHEDLRRDLFEKINEFEGKDPNDVSIKYWIISVYDNYCIVNAITDGDKYFKVPYSIDTNDDVQIGDFQEVEMIWKPVASEQNSVTDQNQETIKELNGQLLQMSSKYETLETEVV